MTAQCRQCGQYKSIKEAKTAELREELDDWYDRQCEGAVERDLDQLLDEARAKDSHWDAHMWFAV